MELERGAFIFTTATGSVYELRHGEPKTLARLPGATAVHPSMDGAEVRAMRRDAEEIEVVEIITLEIGSQGFFILDLRRDGVMTFRRTSEIISVTQVPEL